MYFPKPKTQEKQIQVAFPLIVNMQKICCCWCLLCKYEKTSYRLYSYIVRFLSLEVAEPSLSLSSSAGASF